MNEDNGGLWSVVLAGGEGERMRSFVEEWLGHHKPKQYCSFTGTRSLFQHTVDRADALSGAERRLVVAAPDHRSYLAEQLGGRGEGRVILQPRNRGTAVGVFVALTDIVARDPRAAVVIYPSDHFVYPETAFLDAVRDAVRAAEGNPEGLVLLGVRPVAAEVDYGWIVPSSGGTNGAARRVEAFLEKASRRLAEEALRQGALWNTLVAAARARALWDLGRRVLPEVMPSFIRYGEALRAGDDGAAIERLYTEVPSLDFSCDLLQRAPERLKVLELEGVAWSDWGRPERILETLTALGLPAAFPEELVA